MRRIVILTAMLTTGVLLGGAVYLTLDRRTDPVEAPRLRSSDTVQLMAPTLGPGWHTGTVGTVGNCLVLLIPSPPPPEAPQRFEVIFPSAATRLRVSAAGAKPSDGREQIRGAAAGAASQSNWMEISTSELRERYGNCEP